MNAAKSLLEGYDGLKRQLSISVLATTEDLSYSYISECGRVAQPDRASDF